MYKHVLNKWFGNNGEVANIINWILSTFSIIAAAIGVFLLIAAAWLYFFTKNHEENSNNVPNIVKKSRKFLILGIVACLSSLIWITILGIADAAGVGKLISGDNTFSLVEMTILGVKF